MEVHLLWFVPAPSFDPYCAIWNHWKGVLWQHHWLGDYQQIKQNPSAAHPKVDLILGAAPNSCSDFVAIIQALEPQPPSIWITSDPKAAIAAYRQNISRCLPIPLEPLHIMMMKEQLQDLLIPKKGPAPFPYLYLHDGKAKTLKISLEQTTHIQCLQHQVVIFYKQGHRKIFRNPSPSLCQQFVEHSHFFALSPNHWIRLEAIKKIEKKSNKNYQCFFENNQSIRFSHKDYKRLMKQLK